MTSAAKSFIDARDLLLDLYGQPREAVARFRWPELDQFNWALDYFDHLAASNERPALRVIGDAHADQTLSFADLSRRSNQVANFLSSLDLDRGQTLLLMLGNVPALWETLLGAMKCGVILIPTTPLLQRHELLDRLARGRVAAVVAASDLAERFVELPSAVRRVAVGEHVAGWTSFSKSDTFSERFTADGPTPADSPLLHYFTSGTTSQPKLVEHSHRSYPVGHLSTMYWLGLRPGDRHLNISSPGWAKHAWSSFFAPWNAGATVVALNQARFDVGWTLEQIVRCRVTTLCAPPTVWRLIVQAPLERYATNLRELASAGEPLNPEVIEHIRRAWGLSVRDGYGQTETTALVGNMPGLVVQPGSMGCTLPGYDIELLDADGGAAAEGELCVRTRPRPAGLMNGYRADSGESVDAATTGYYRTGDVAQRDVDGYFTFVGRTDDIFKSSDYRISPFELESVLVEHPAVVEAAVVPSPDARRLAVPKAFIVLASGFEPSAEIAFDILTHARSRLSAFKRVRRIQFAVLPKTVSGKIRRGELREAEHRRDFAARLEHEFWEDDFARKE